MDSVVRREEILKLLKRRMSPITGSELAEKMGVSRQIIVTDIALLRAKGEEILATPQGYIHTSTITEKDYMTKIVCKHTSDEIREELSTILKFGGEIIDVIVEHPVYGELKGLLMISSFKDLDEFIYKMRQTQAKPLSLLTEGAHIHTIKAPKKQMLEEIKNELLIRDFLVEDN
ncbi:MAG TPA: transcription repressor NadR [Thermoanaerobacterales bacterium]|nr:transcription repressor NadR [Thermoanaerobacterales bacterium]